MTRPSLQIVLVRPQYSSNIGFCARAMGNMGASQLNVIAPECDSMDLKAHQSAAGAQGPLESMRSFPSWDEFLSTSEEGVRIAMSAREGKARPSVLLPDLMQVIYPKIESEESRSDFKNIYLVFGPEDDGLSSEDLLRCHFTAKIPIYGEFKSLNLGHACLIAQYIVQDFLVRNFVESEQSQSKDVEALPTEAQAFYPYELIATSLENIGFKIDHSRKNAAKKLTDLFMRAIPSEQEADLIKKVFYQMKRKILEAKDERN